MPAAARVSPWWVRTMVVGPRRATTRAVSSGSSVLAGAGHDPALGLADHLAGDQHDVAVGELHQAGQQRGEVVALPDLADAVGGEQLAAGSPGHQLDRGGGHGGGRVVVGHHQRYGGRAPGRPRAARRARRRPARRPASRRARRRRCGRRSGGRRPRRDASTPIAASSCSAIPRTWWPPTMGESPTTGAGVAASASRTPGTPRIVPTETTGLDGGSTTRSAPVIASTTPGCRGGVVLPDHDDRLGRHLGPQPDPVLLEVDDAAAAGRVGVGDGDVGLDPVVGHRQQPEAVAVQRA